MIINTITLKEGERIEIQFEGLWRSLAIEVVLTDEAIKIFKGGKLIDTTNLGKNKHASII